jgi:holo-[acyl-carrier protein] synthase
MILSANSLQNSILGIGTDIVEKQRIAKVIKKHGDKFALKILHHNEVQKYESFLTLNKKIDYIAKRFAAKEAFLKALGTGLRAGISLKHIETSNDALGKPQITLHKNKLFNIKQSKIHLSIADEKALAIAFVVIEK